MVDVHVHEVGTRDGLQSVPLFVPTEMKKAWCIGEAEAGVRAIEVCLQLPIKGHFHDTRGVGLANVLAALDADVRAFDASLGGLWGCPYASGRARTSAPKTTRSCWRRWASGQE